jgi:hypothetical protein
VQARDERRMRWQKWNRQQQQSPGSCSAQSRCFDLWAAGADSEGRARSLPRALRSVPQATSLDISCRQSNCQTIRLFTTTTTTTTTTTSSSQLLQSHRTTASSHCQPHYSHTTTDTTMADKFPSVEDLDSGIPLHLAHYSPHLD